MQGVSPGVELANKNNARILVCVDGCGSTTGLKLNSVECGFAVVC